MKRESGQLESVLPGGTVTFLFTDIEGSTQLLHRLRDQYTILIAGHDQIIRNAIARWSGRVVDTQGDAFFAAFPKATGAVAAVVDVQRALAQHNWPKGVQLRVRMGLHTGEPWLVEKGYMGIDVHRAARIGHAGHGRQVLLSETATALVQDELPEGVSLEDLGRHRLKDMRRPERLHQLVIDGLPSEFPPLKSLEAIAPTPISPEVVPGREIREVGDSPYRGLAAFRETDASLFFGREAFTAQLFKAVQERGLVAVIVGPSGSGKSSTVFAGLLPQLRKNQKWLIVEARPGGKPFHALAGALLPILEDRLGETKRLIETQRLAQAMRDGELGLFQVVIRALERQPEAQRALLVIDQFEELFTLRPDPETQRLFLDELLTAAAAGAAHRRSPLVLLLTLRADFMGQALTHRPFADALQEGSLILGPMNREELQAAVEKPAQLQGAAFETGLVHRILDDVGHEPGNLPLLEFALTLLWERLEGGWMTHAAYEEIGRVEGALARYAEEVLTELDENEHEGARRLFVQLVQPGEGTEDTRRVAKRSELAEKHWPLIRHLADRRLVVTGRDEAGDNTVEVVHEALIRSWDRLRSWMKEDRAFRTWQEGLRVSQRNWQNSGRDDGALLRGAPLSIALEWAKGHGPGLSQSDKSYIRVSWQANKRQEELEEIRRQRELETAQRLAKTEHARAEEQAQSAGSLRRRAVYLGVALVVAALLAIAAGLFAHRSNLNATLAEEREVVAISEANQRATAEAEAITEAGHRATAQAQAETEAINRATAEAVAIQEREIAEEQSRLAFSRELAAAALDSLAEDQERAVLLAIQALSQARTQEAEDALHRTVQEFRLLRTLGAPGKSAFLAMSPDGRRFISSGPAGAAIWDADTGENLYSIDISEGFVNRAAFSPDSSLLITPNEGGDYMAPSTVTIYEAETGEELLTFLAHDAWVQVVSFNPDGTLFATAGGDGVAKIWDLDATLDVGEGVQRLALQADEVSLFDMQFSPDGNLLATANREDFGRIWDVNTGQVLWQTADMFAAAFSPDGTRLVTGGGDTGMLNVYDALTGQRLSRTLAHSNSIQSVVFTLDGTRVATTGNDSTVKVWAFSEDVLSPHLTLTGHKERAMGLDVSPDGERLISSSLDDGTVRVWDISPDGSGEPIFYYHGAGLNGVAFNPEGTRVATAGGDGAVRIWDVTTGEEVHVLSGGNWIWQVVFSPDGALIATADGDATVKLRWPSAPMGPGWPRPAAMELSGYGMWLPSEKETKVAATNCSSWNSRPNWIGLMMSLLALTGPGWPPRSTPMPTLLVIGGMETASSKSGMLLQAN